MGKAEEFLKEERKYYGKIYAEISFAIDNTSTFLSEEDKKKRKFIVKLPSIKNYVDIIEASLGELKQEGLRSIFKGDKYTSLVKSYKSDNEASLKQLEKCYSCSCLNCISLCKFESCHGCREASNIESCDHKKINVSKYTSFTIDLINSKSGRMDKYKVLATLEDCNKNKKYIILQNLKDFNDKYILYYDTGIHEDTYGEIKDVEEFDYILTTFEEVDV
ncbi:MAG TPA: DUF1292 domain-containing protein [Clostridiaceae bacterium]